MARLNKEKQYDWKDTNLALFGSDLDHETKKAAACTEKAWRRAGVKAGLQIWRIVNFKVQSWPVTEYGKFYDGDSYIILNTYQQDNSEALLYDVHFWIGKYSTQDEYCTAAYKTVELDTYLDDKPIQHRQVQGHETRLFKSYFQTIEILRGGAESGFRKVELKSYIPRLLHFHGDNKHVEIVEVNRSRDVLESSDVFILDLGHKIYQWNGRYSNKDERYRAALHVNTLKLGRGSCTSETLDEYISLCGVFYSKLDAVSETEQTQKQNQNKDDVSHVTDDVIETKKLFRLSDEGGEMAIKLKKSGTVSIDDFDTNDAFILDTCNDVFVWIGKSASRNERRNAMSYAHNYLMGTSHPLLPITCIGEETISADFQTAITA